MTNDPIAGRLPLGSGRTGHAQLALALTITAGLLSGCGDRPEDVETAESALTTQTSTLDFGITTRAKKQTCGQRCAKFTIPPISFPPQFPRCTQWVTDCSVPSTKVTLHADATAAAWDAVFPEYDEGPAYQYRGCGPKAAQNVLNYYGVQMSIADVSLYVSTFALRAGELDQNIATYPDDLASGLQRLLNEKIAPNRFVVSRHSGVNITTAIQDSIRKGNPIVVLVNGGDHYQVVTGFDSGSAYVTDYAGQSKWRAISDMGTDLPWYYDILIFDGGLEDDTVVTIDYLR
jgi:Peptidase_C39 like family